MSDASRPSVPAHVVKYLPPCLCRHNVKLRALVQRNGMRQYAIWCIQTGYRGSFVPKAIVETIAATHGVAVVDIPVYRDNRTGCCDGGGCETCSTACTHCGSFAQVQYHHWAPRYLFDDADMWPGDFLCAVCHRRWHATVTPRMNVRQAG